MARHTFVLTAGVVAVGAQSFVLAPLLPDIAAGLGTGVTEVGRAFAAYGLGVLVSALGVGPWLDRVARRPALAAGLVAVLLGAIGSASATGWGGLAAAQALVGVGVGVVLPVTYALAAELAAPGADLRATGRVLTGWSIALVGGVPLSALLGDAVGWRGAFVALGVGAAVQIVALGALPASRPVQAPRPAGFGAALRAPGVPRLLLGVGASMTAFYAVFGFAGTELRAEHGDTAAVAALLALAYGSGFGLGATLDRYLDRLGGHRLVAPALGLLAVVYLALGASVAWLPVVLTAAVVWGVANHVVLTALVGGLSAATDARGPVLALNAAATSGGAVLAGALAGPLRDIVGFAWLTVASAAVVAAAVPVLARRSPARSDPARPAARREVPGPVR